LLSIKSAYKELGEKITVLVAEGEGRFPVSRKDPKPVVDFIVSRQGSGDAPTRLSEALVAFHSSLPRRVRPSNIGRSIIYSDLPFLTPSAIEISGRTSGP
jgi:hypothetical protein